VSTVHANSGFRPVGPRGERYRCDGRLLSRHSEDGTLLSLAMVQEASVVGGGNRDGMGSQSVA
jgi:hypothetical protein